MTPAQIRLWRQCDALALVEAGNGSHRRARGNVQFCPTPRHSDIVGFMATIGDMSDEDAIYQSERISAFGLDAWS